MREWVSGGLLTVGTLIVIASAIRATRAWQRYLRSRKEDPDHGRERALAGVQLAYSNAWNGALLAAGLEIFVGGAVLDSSMQSSSLLWPVGFLAAAVFAALFMRRTLAQLRKSDPGQPAPLR
jgi:MFS family permease